MKNLLFQYLKKLNKIVGKKLYIHGLLSVILSFMQGVGIFMLIPLLSFTGIMNQGEESTNSFVNSIVQFLPKEIGQYYLLLILFIYVFIIALQSLMTRYQTIMNVEIQQEFVTYLRDDLHKNIIKSKWEYILKQRLSDFSHLLTSEINRIGNGTNALNSFCSNFVILLVHIIIAFVVSPGLTVFALICGLLLALFIYPISKQSKKMGLSISTNTREIFAEISKHFDGFKETKCYGIEEGHIDRFNELNSGIKDNRIQFTRVQSKISVYYKISSALIIVMFYYCITYVFKSDSNTLLILLFVFSRIWPKFSSLQDQMQRILLMLPAYREYTKVLDQCKREKEDTNIEADRNHIKLDRSIKLKNISYKYDKEQEYYIIKNIDIKIKAYATTVITGVSGSGKSTLIDIIIGLLKPENGQIIVDDKTILDESNIKSWRGQISYVPQTSYLFNGSIRDNLLWVNNNATEEEIWNCVKSAAAYDFVEKLPKGLDTIVGDHGIRLSGGERQRLVLARALLRKPSILILDEATSALDYQNEEFIRRAIQKLHKKLTIVMITHRLTSTKDADEIFVVEKGKIIEKGRFDNLEYLK